MDYKKQSEGLISIVFSIVFFGSATPEFMLPLAYAQEEEDNPFLKALREAELITSARHNVSTVDAQTPKTFNSIKEGDIAPFPMENQIMMEFSFFLII
jgi:hypothetical protein